MNAKTVAAATLGCKVNFYETQAMLELFAEAGYEIVDFSDKAAVYIINTCTVTNLGDRKSRGLIRKAAARNPEAVIAAVGCYVQAAEAELAAMPEIDLLIGTKDKGQIVSIVEAHERGRGQKSFVGGLSAREVFEPLSVTSMNERHRAFIKVQDGCDRYCAYCIIPYVRGPVRSRGLADIAAELERVAKNGYKEVVLSGIHVSSYGKDLGGGTGLLELILLASGIDGIERVRLSSLEPTIMTDSFIAQIAKLPKLCDHFHLSLQSGCDATLKRMNRRYTAGEYEAAVNAIRAHFPGAAVTTDVIVGFPGESEDDFEESYEFCRRVGLSKIHVFPYSAKKGTKAAAMTGQIPPEVKEQRSKRMLALSAELSRDFASRFEYLPTLFEKQIGKNSYMGYTTNYLPAACESETDLTDTIGIGRVSPAKY